MNFKLLISVLALAVLGAGWVAGAGAGADYALRSRSVSIQAAAPARPELDMFSAKPRLGLKAPTEIGIRIPATAAEVGKWTLYVPAGYGFDIGAAPGTPEGHVVMQTASDIGLGDLRAADPAKYVDSPQAQACAPGPHAAVWTMKFDALSSEIPTVPIYIDPTSGADTALGAYELQACLPLAQLASPGGTPLGSRLRTLAVEFTRLTNPTATALYVWRAFVSNPPRPVRTRVSQPVLDASAKDVPSPSQFAGSATALTGPPLRGHSGTPAQASVLGSEGTVHLRKPCVTRLCLLACVTWQLVPQGEASCSGVCSIYVCLR
jgi:hypothetical protein